MTYLATPLVSSTPVSFGNQIQDNTWTIYEFITDRASVTTLSSQPSTHGGLIEPWERIITSISSPPSIRALRAPIAYWEALPISSENFGTIIKALKFWNEKMTSAALLMESQIQWLERCYVFRDGVEVTHILRKYPFLIQLLVDAYSKIEVYFPDPQIFLDVSIDYEVADDQMTASNNKELAASIGVDLPHKDALEALKKFYNGWWLKVSQEAKGKLSIGLEFI